MVGTNDGYISIQKILSVFFFQKKLHFTWRVLKQRHMTCYELHSGSKIADTFKMVAIIDQTDVTKHYKMMMFFNCCVWMHVYSTKGFWLLKGIVYWCKNRYPATTSVSAKQQFTPVVTEHSYSSFEPRVFHYCTFCKASTTISTSSTVYLYSKIQS